MTERCQEHRSELVALIKGDLRALEQERLRGHLRNCSVCAAVHAELSAGLEQAGAWEPEVPAEHLEHLTARLQPYMVQQRGARPAWTYALAAATAAVLAVGAAWIALTEVPTSNGEPAVVAGVPLIAPSVPARAGAILRDAPVPHLRMVTSEDWEGRVEGDPDDLTVTLSGGFAVLAFAGNGQRRLKVSAPGAWIEVVGTRFFVDTDGEVTKVGVGEGRVQVLTLTGEHSLAIGDTMATALSPNASCGDGSDSRAAPFLDDPYLRAIHRETAEIGRAPIRAPIRSAIPIHLGRLARSEPGAAPRATANAVPPARATPPPKTDILEQLALAEDLASRGDVEAAIETYRLVSEDTRPENQAFRDMSRYEMARLWGFKLGEIRRARSILRALAKPGKGEVSRQAELALCELDLEARPCEAARCLARLVDQSPDFQLVQEAKGLLEHWGLESSTCGRQER